VKSPPLAHKASRLLGSQRRPRIRSRGVPWPARKSLLARLSWHLRSHRTPAVQEATGARTRGDAHPASSKPCTLGHRQSIAPRTFRICSSEMSEPTRVSGLSGSSILNLLVRSISSRMHASRIRLCTKNRVPFDRTSRVAHGDDFPVCRIEHRSFGPGSSASVRQSRRRVYAGPLPAAYQQPPTTQIWLSTRCYCLFISLSRHAGYP
jgi:hypothetical protein